MLDDDEKNKTKNAATHNQLIIILIFFSSSSSSLAVIVCSTMSFFNHFVSRLKTFPSFWILLWNNVIIWFLAPPRIDHNYKLMPLLFAVALLLQLPGVCVSVYNTPLSFSYWKHSTRESNSRINLIFFVLCHCQVRRRRRCRHLICHQLISHTFAFFSFSFPQTNSHNEY